MCCLFEGDEQHGVCLRASATAQATSCWPSLHAYWAATAKPSTSTCSPAHGPCDSKPTHSNTCTAGKAGCHEGASTEGPWGSLGSAAPLMHTAVKLSEKGAAAAAAATGRTCKQCGKLGESCSQQLGCTEVKHADQSRCSGSDLNAACSANALCSARQVRQAATLRKQVVAQNRQAKCHMTLTAKAASTSSPQSDPKRSPVAPQSDPSLALVLSRCDPHIDPCQLHTATSPAASAPAVSR